MSKVTGGLGGETGILFQMARLGALQHANLSMQRFFYVISGLLCNKWRFASGAQGREKYLVAGVGKALGEMKSSRVGFRQAKRKRIKIKIKLHRI